MGSKKIGNQLTDYTNVNWTIISFVVWIILIVGFSLIEDRFFPASNLSNNLCVQIFFCIPAISFIPMLGYIAITVNRKKLIDIHISQIDSMSGIDFEKYVKALLDFHGFRTEAKGGSGDLGVDIVATKRNNRYAIQIKRQASKVSRRAVSDAVAGKAYHHCNTSAVITNNYFTEGAIKLAKSNDCLLIDRDYLTKMIIQFQRGKSQ